MNPLLIASTSWQSALAFLALGSAAGLVHFGLLWRTAQAVTRGRVAAAFIHAVIRFGVTGGVLLLASRWGAASLLSAALGLMAARFVVLRVQGYPAR